MSLSLEQRIVGAVFGSIIGDAVAVGLHWIYSDDGIALAKKELPHGKLAFADPATTKPFYAIMPSYYAHGYKKSGDSSHYGAVARLGVQSIVRVKSIGTVASVKDFKKELQTQFGYGGPYVGYVDAAIRLTLQSIDAEVPNALDKVERGDVDAETAHAILKIKVLPLVKRGFEGDDLIERVVAAVKASHDTPAAIDLGRRAARAASDATLQPSGKNEDNQMNALVRQVAATAFTVEVEEKEALRQVREWTRLTQDNEETLAYITVTHALLRAVLRGDSVLHAIGALDAKDHADVAALLERAKKETSSAHRDFVGQVGRACFLKAGVPSTVQLLGQLLAQPNLRPEEVFERAIEETIYAGGDSCGRAAYLGALLGAQYGVQGIPAHYVASLKDASAVLAEAHQLAALALSTQRK